MRCTALPFYEFREGIYEIDEFECVSAFVIKGSERALLIDTGTGIGDLKWVVENRVIPGCAYEVVASHNHLDHIGGAGWFDQIYMHEADINETDIENAKNLDDRIEYAQIITKREGKYYPYEYETDILEWPKYPEFIPIEDGHVFDLGDRKVTAFHCPGHTKGELVFLDDKTRTLLVGDAFNCNFYFRSDLAETPREGLKAAYNAAKRIYDMRDQYDYVINSHHDFRGFGNPLNPDVLPNLTHCLESLVNHTAIFKTVKDPLSKDGGTRTSAVYGDVEVSVLGKIGQSDLSIDQL